MYGLVIFRDQGSLGVIKSATPRGTGVVFSLHIIVIVTSVLLCAVCGVFGVVRSGRALCHHF